MTVVPSSFSALPPAIAVRIGDLEAFQTVLTQHASKFSSDGTHSLIVRLRHNVIKTALRMISLAYSRISLKDVCLKLHLDSEEDTEYIVAKAIRDGVIDAEVDHAQGWMKSREAGNVYETDEPQKAFQQRIEFCMNLHNESVKVGRLGHRGNVLVRDGHRPRADMIVSRSVLVRRCGTP